jgi:very-short-patch-repair endonuclease
MLWPDARLIIELDGERAHSSPAQLAADAERQAWLEAQGYTVIRFTHEQVARDPAGVAAAVARHLSA